MYFVVEDLRDQKQNTDCGGRDQSAKNWPLAVFQLSGRVGDVRSQVSHLFSQRSQALLHTLRGGICNEWNNWLFCNNWGLTCPCKELTFLWLHSCKIYSWQDCIFQGLKIKHREIRPSFQVFQHCISSITQAQGKQLHNGTATKWSLPASLQLLVKNSNTHMLTKTRPNPALRIKRQHCQFCLG